MPYELEYKKVHNTLGNKKNENCYGYDMGNRVTFITDEYITLTSQDLQYVLQNNTNTNQTILIYFYDENENVIADAIEFDNGGLYSWPDASHKSVQCVLNANECVFIKLPAKQTFLTVHNNLITPTKARIIRNNCSM